MTPVPARENAEASYIIAYRHRPIEGKFAHLAPDTDWHVWTWGRSLDDSVKAYLHLTTNHDIAFDGLSIMTKASVTEGDAPAGVAGRGLGKVGHLDFWLVIEGSSADPTDPKDRVTRESPDLTFIADHGNV